MDALQQLLAHYERTISTVVPVFLILIGLALAACTVQPSERDIQTAIAQTEAHVPTPFPTSEYAKTDEQKQEDVIWFIKSLLDHPNYDPESQVIHKYFDTTLVNVEGDILIFTVVADIEDEREFLALAEDLIVGGAFISTLAPANDWGLERIELIWPGPSNSFVKVYVEGQSVIQGISDGRINLYDVLETDVRQDE